jgi:hypothetical protein
MPIHEIPTKQWKILIEEYTFKHAHKIFNFSHLRLQTIYAKLSKIFPISRFCICIILIPNKAKNGFKFGVVKRAKPSFFLKTNLVCLKGSKTFWKFYFRCQLVSPHFDNFGILTKSFNLAVLSTFIKGKPQCYQ